MGCSTKNDFQSKLKPDSKDDVILYDRVYKCKEENSSITMIYKINKDGSFEEIVSTTEPGVDPISARGYYTHAPKFTMEGESTMFAFKVNGDKSGLYRPYMITDTEIAAFDQNMREMFACDILSLIE